MKVLKDVFQDRTINSFIVAFMIGFSTAQFIYILGQQLLVPVTQTGSPQWSWAQFWPQLVIWIVTVLVAIGISRLSKNK